MSTFFPCHSVIAGDRAARIRTRKAALSLFGAATPGRDRHSFVVTSSPTLANFKHYIRSIRICQL
jgi:hypothetical protein